MSNETNGDSPGAPTIELMIPTNPESEDVIMVTPHLELPPNLNSTNEDSPKEDLPNQLGQNQTSTNTFTMLSPNNMYKENIMVHIKSIFVRIKIMMNYDRWHPAVHSTTVR